MDVYLLVALATFLCVLLAVPTFLRYTGRGQSSSSGGHQGKYFFLSNTIKATALFNCLQSEGEPCSYHILILRGGGQSAYHVTMILPFLAQRLFLIQISWNSKSVLSLGSYTWKNGQIRSADRDRRFFAKKNFQQKFSPKKTEQFWDLSRWHDSFISSR